MTSGVLTVIRNDEVFQLKAGESIEMQLGDIHAMANMSDEPCIVHEVQTGICFEEDIHRFLDFGGRPVEQSVDPRVLAANQNARVEMQKYQERKAAAAPRNGR